MTETILRNLRAPAIVCLVAACVSDLPAQNGSAYFHPSNLVVSRSVYNTNNSNIKVGMMLPPNCTSGCGQAVVDGTYPYVWNN